MIKSVSPSAVLVRCGTKWGAKKEKKSVFFIGLVS